MFIFTDHTSSSSSSSSSCSAAAVPSGCMSEDDLRIRGETFEAKYKDKTRDLGQKDTRDTCEQAAKDTSGGLNTRSSSPWRLNREDDRFPRDIFFAECLCEGCIIDGHEIHLDYNSVRVNASLMVLRKISCPGYHDKYKVRKEIISVPVACTCVTPKVISSK
ncbi:Interleukin-17C [Collichthys lucidus]|uniref:Interleukin-17C n=1 Tax=Collichthys lucidus TaxID=240159 RepID=A0A4U5U7Z1_COLLU|nr:Interleukin-17C [Collichthys lucidus]